MLTGIVAVVGRPNVGKSTLFNRLTRSGSAIVDDRPGVTRDRLYGTVWIDKDEGQGFTLIDTGGFETDDLKYQPFAGNIVWQQTELAIAEADLVLLVLDGKDGVNPHDRHLVRQLARMGKPFIAAVNKIDGREQRQNELEFYELGLAEVRAISAAHGHGIPELLEEIEAKLAETAATQRRAPTEGATRIAIIGRPNAGKSSILNRLLGEERSLVSDVAGTTRDAIDAEVTYDGRAYVLVDTAGVRRRSKISERLEGLSVALSLRAIDAADVVVLVLDAVQGFAEQDARLADLAIERHKPLLIVVNKWDLVTDKNPNTAKEYADTVRYLAKTLAFAPIVFVSCASNQRVHSLLGHVARLADMGRKRADTRVVNETLRKIVSEHTPALIRGKTRRIKFYFATQVAVSPPTIVVFCNVASEIHASYLRYMVNRFRELLGFTEIPIRMLMRTKAQVRERAASRQSGDADVALRARKAPAPALLDDEAIELDHDEWSALDEAEQDDVVFGDEASDEAGDHGGSDADAEERA
jgi:GTP-binding protein